MAMFKHEIFLGSLFLSTACFGHSSYLNPLSFEPSWGVVKLKWKKMKFVVLTEKY